MRSAFFPKGRSNQRGGLPHRVASGHGVRGLQHRWLLRCQRFHHGQRPQSPPGSRRRRQAGAGDPSVGIWRHFFVNVLRWTCRHWQDLGYLIIYITGRPDMQKQRVVSWLSQHNFPHGMIFFSEGLVHDPLRQKTIFLKHLIQEVRPGGDTSNLDSSAAPPFLWCSCLSHISARLFPLPSVTLRSSLLTAPWRTSLFTTCSASAPRRFILLADLQRSTKTSAW